MQIVGDARDKLGEAIYFLSQMENTRSERDAFRFNLSAFLAGARSVTLFMQKEFNKTQGFHEWYKVKQEEMRNDQAMRLLHDKRTMTIHQQSVRPRAEVKVGISEQVTISDSLSMVVIRASGTREEIGFEPTQPVRSEAVVKETTVDWQWYFRELPEKDVVTLCREHIEKLVAIVGQCETKFPRPSQ